MPIVQFLESLASVKYNQKMDCFLLGKKRMAIEPNAIAPQKYSDFFDNKPMVLPEPQGVEGSGSSCMPFKNRTMMPVSSSSFSSAGTHSRTLSAPSQLYRSGYDRMPLPSVGSCNAVPSQIWPISETRNECFQSAFVEAGRAIGSSNRGYRKASSFSKSITSKGRPTSLPPRKHEAHPLPLPVPQKNLEERFAGEACDLGSVNIIVSSHAGVQASLNSLNLTTCTSDAHRLPLPSEVLQKKAPLRKFTYEELSSGCRNFSSSYLLRETSVGPVYRSLVKDTQGNGEKTTVAVTCLKRLHLKDEDEWISYMTGLAKLDNPYLCRLSGFCNLASFDRRKDDYDKMLVFEHMENESLDRLLLRKQDEPPLGWFTRLKIALGTAKGLAYLYDKSPFQGFYEDFNMSNVQIDKDCTPKLSDYGLHQLCGVDISLPVSICCLCSSFTQYSLGKLCRGKEHCEKLWKGSVRTSFCQETPGKGA
ncbi:hypothetical protein O6H91_20G054500 [Diphasiastrum complanatum]|uniref:Uncharacterized protein n=1 Tax=Diphasiastrum complanatum TaxID=34168 RepID=A0ACC2AQM2_DIPCM|nr:hypothetical protein O6H91_20G054500 [Diphasiastrum complanatum]